MPKGQAAVMYTSHLHIQNTLFNSHVNSIISDKHLGTGWLWNVIHDVFKMMVAVKIDKYWKYNILFVWEYKNIWSFYIKITLVYKKKYIRFQKSFWFIWDIL